MLHWSFPTACEIYIQLVGNCALEGETFISVQNIVFTAEKYFRNFLKFLHKFSCSGVKIGATMPEVPVQHRKW